MMAVFGLAEGVCDEDLGLVPGNVDDVAVVVEVIAPA